MAINGEHSDARAFVDEIDRAEKIVALHVTFINKLKQRLSRTKKTLLTQPSISVPVAALVKDLRAMPTEPDRIGISQVADGLEQRLQPLRHRMETSLAHELLQRCEEAKLPFKSLQGAYGVGPFRVIVNMARERAFIDYAKTVVDKDVSLVPAKIVDRAIALKAAILDDPVNIGVVSAQIEEAIRVALVRQRKRLQSELRVELPVVFREMAFIRQSPVNAGSRTSPFSVPRFVVELRTLVQSDLNLKGERQFRLETAVLENAKDPKKSVFVPNDPACGFGEGTYYQAIVLRVP